MKRALLSVVLSLSALCICTYAQSGLPSKCKPCLFYGGDLNPNDPNADAFPNEVTNNLGASTYASIIVPKGHILLIEGILFQTVFEYYDQTDPQSAVWQIRTGDIFNNGGTLVAEGGAPLSTKPTGRSLNGWPEYTLAIEVNPPVQLSGGSRHPGTQYWFNFVPQCTAPNNPNCDDAQYLASNTTQQTNGFRAFAQPGETIVLDSSSYGYNWAQCASVGGYNGIQCSYLSFGLMGTVVQ
jgi:hypothetical protein